MNNKKKVFVATIKCPSCQAIIEVLKEVEVIREPVKGERKERYFAEKSIQKLLTDTE
jgi:Zn ribbon nucleic-acid-binding protein